MSAPVFASHDKPVSVTVKDFLVQAWIDNASAPASDQVWTIELAGKRHVGPRVDAERHASLHDVKEMLRQWSKEHSSLFV